MRREVEWLGDRDEELAWEVVLAERIQARLTNSSVTKPIAKTEGAADQRVDAHVPAVASSHGIT